MAGTNDKQIFNKISEEIICKAAMKATLGVPGVSSLCDSFTDNLTKMLYGKDSASSGVKVNIEKDGTVQIDIFVIVKFGMKIPQVAWDIQNAVKDSVKNIAELELAAVNIHVQGVSW